MTRRDRNQSLFEQSGDAGAVFSPCRSYRYNLWRTWGSGGKMINFICLNPSTADEFINDPTVERLERRARTMGFDGMTVTNIFAWRSTDPRGLVLQTRDPIGPQNNHYILQTAQSHEMVVCAWGRNGSLMSRSKDVVTMLYEARVELNAFRVSEKTGQPEHPLYISYQVKPTPWRPDPDTLRECPAVVQSPA